ncbi:hypothetical protein M5689_007215 [Euphorbia peplus]|nr:hypothetical protein M5689_007215 [Euphorbia peplus]
MARGNIGRISKRGGGRNGGRTLPRDVATRNTRTTTQDDAASSNGTSTQDLAASSNGISTNVVVGANGTSPPDVACGSNGTSSQDVRASNDAIHATVEPVAQTSADRNTEESEISNEGEHEAENCARTSIYEPLNGGRTVNGRQVIRVIGKR